LAGESGLVVVEHTVQLADLVAATEAFAAGTSCGVIGIVKIDDQTIGTGTEGPVTRRLRESYRALTRGDG
jgi:branched-subunit amino acid aminotransferase/4-amino-4-deoxychorismate lyase